MVPVVNVTELVELRMTSENVAVKEEVGLTEKVTIKFELPVGIVLLGISVVSKVVSGVPPDVDMFFMDPESSDELEEVSKPVEMGGRRVIQDTVDAVAVDILWSTSAP